MDDTTEAGPIWVPAVQIDLNTVSAIGFQEALDKFAEWAKTQPDQKPGFKNGWHCITPQQAEALLLRNKRNRKVSLATVKTYARRMRAGAWKKTGQPVLLNEEGEVADAQHRLWACYFSGVSFDTYIVADVPMEADLFAYIDAGKIRNAADALYTSGSNGLSASIASAVKLAYRYDHAGLGIIKQPVMRALDNVEVLEYNRQHPKLAQAAHIVASNYPRAINVIGSKGVATFVAWKIFDQYGIDALEDFFQPLGSGAKLEENDPILHLRNRLMAYQEGDDDLSQPHRLALIIKGFNMHRTDQTVGKRGFYLRDNEKYPRFEAPQPLAEAAQ
jgi:hypothetical protein